jgi:hypothetical protein
MMSLDELMALPPSVPIDIANRALGIGRTKGYDLAKREIYPCAVMRLGKQYRVITADLWRILNVTPRNVGSEDSTDLRQAA